MLYFDEKRGGKRESRERRSKVIIEAVDFEGQTKISLHQGEREERKRRKEGEEEEHE